MTKPSMHSPVRIYLDTSDYSRFADIGHHKQSEEIPAILDSLREKKSQGLIEVRFSAIHLVEFLKNQASAPSLFVKCSW